MKMTNAVLPFRRAWMVNRNILQVQQLAGIEPLNVLDASLEE